MKKLIAVLILTAAFSTGIVSAQTTFEAFLSGLNENPPNLSPATGFGTVILNAAQTQITVDESWSGLIGGPATASHIHTGVVGVNGPVTFPFSGVPATTSGSIPEQTFAITPAQLADLLSGGMYMNVHDGQNPSGEIRGQLTVVPEPGTLALAGLGAAGMVARVWRRKDRAIKS